jgi:hypothetical protein
MMSLLCDLLIFTFAWMKGIKYTRKRCPNSGKLIIVCHMEAFDGGPDMVCH